MHLRPSKGAGFDVCRTRLERGDRCVVRSIPAARIERGVIELAREAPVRRVLQVVDSGRWLGLLRIERLGAASPRACTRARIAAVRAARLRAA